MTKDEIILAQQARIEQLREAATLALETIESNAHERRHVRWKLKDALSFHDDLAALRAHDEKLLATTTLAAKDVLAERDKIIALARDAISYALRKDYNCNGITCAKNLEEALAAIDDSKLVAGMVLCSTKRDRKRDAALLREADKVWWELDYGSFEKLAKARESGDWEPELEVK